MRTTVPLVALWIRSSTTNTANLPVTTDQLWATGGIIGATIVVVLGCVLMPGGLQGLGSWIASGDPLEGTSTGQKVDRSRGRPVQRATGGGQYSRKQPRLRPIAPLLTRAARPAIQSKPALSYAQQKEAYHLAHLRATPLILPYSDQGKVPIAVFLLTSIGAILFLVIVFGQLVKAGYAADASAPAPDKPKSSGDVKPSVEEEYQAREKRKTASETPEQTAARRKKEKPMWDKRRKEEAASKPKVAKLTVRQMYDAAEKKKTVGETPEETARRREKEKPKWDERFKREKENAAKSKKETKNEDEKPSVAEPQEGVATASTKAKLERSGQGLKRRLAGLTGSS